MKTFLIFSLLAFLSADFASAGSINTQVARTSLNQKNSALAVVPPGNALHFSGTDESVNIPANEAFQMAVSTIECWVKRDALTGANVTLVANRSSNDTRFSVHMGDDLVGLWNGNLWSYVKTTPFLTGKWYHIAMAIGTGSADVFIDGIYIGQTQNGMGIANGLPLSIGAPFAGSGYQVFNGTIDEVRVWNTLRMPSQIKADMFDIPAPDAAGLVAYFPLDQGGAGEENEDITTANDVSSHHLNGSLSGFALSGSTSNWIESYAMVIPVANGAANANFTSVTAKWTPPVHGIAEKYLLDVSVDANFSTFLPGFESKDVGPATTFAINGTSGSTFYFRVRAEKSSVSGQGVYSNTAVIHIPKIWYVKTGDRADANGNDWDHAFGDLQQAINASFATDKIWVAAGTYKPRRPANDPSTVDELRPTNAFVLKDGVKIYGGFDGTETTLRSWKGFATNKTILSGDLDGDNTFVENALHVVISVSDSQETLLDGFTIEDGNAMSEVYYGVEGIDIYGKRGGGIYNHGSSVRLAHISFKTNSAVSGSAMYNNLSTPLIINSVFGGNEADLNGGGTMRNDNSNSIITNTVFAVNGGGGIYNKNSNPVIANSIIWGNQSVSNENSNPLFLNNILKGSGGSVAWNSVYGTDGGGNLEKSPLFANADALQFNLMPNSPAIDAGSDEAYMSGGGNPAFDLDGAGYVRKTGSHIDMGPFEYNPADPLPVKLIHFTAQKSGGGAEAKTSIITWSTSSETDTDYFEIQRSDNSIEWRKVGKVDAAGDSKDLLNYTFTDITPLSENAGCNDTVYYRLKIVDQDSRFSYSRIVSVQFEKVASVILHPNPVADRLMIDSKYPVRSVEVYSINGQRLSSSNNKIQDLSQLPSGFYIVKVNGVAFKILKQ